MTGGKGNNKWDQVWVGTVIGLVAPVVTLFIFYLIRYNHLTFLEFYSKILVANNVLTPSISLCVIVNLGVFLFFDRSHMSKAARGILAATFIYLGFVVYQKYIR